MKRNIQGYTFEISEVEDGFSIEITKPNGDKRIGHSGIRTAAIRYAYETIENDRRNNKRR